MYIKCGGIFRREKERRGKNTRGVVVRARGNSQGAVVGMGNYHMGYRWERVSVRLTYQWRANFICGSRRQMSRVRRRRCDANFRNRKRKSYSIDILSSHTRLFPPIVYSHDESYCLDDYPNHSRRKSLMYRWPSPPLTPYHSPPTPTPPSYLWGSSGREYGNSNAWPGKGQGSCLKKLRVNRLHAIKRL